MVSDTRTAIGERERSRWLLRPAARKAWLSAHVIVSVGWIGADLCLLFLGIRALTTADARIGQGAVLQEAAIATFVTGPLVHLTLFTGIVVSVTGRWGLFRYWWVTVSLALTVVMDLMVNLALVPLLSGLAARVLGATPGAAVPEVLGSGAVELVIPPSVALVVLTFVTVINVYKPWGRIRRG